MSTKTTGSTTHVTVPVKLTEKRSATGELKLSGLAAPYGRESLDIGFHEIIEPGAFRGLDDGDLLLLWQHNSAMPLARRSAGNLTVTDTAAGVGFSATLPSTSFARDAVELVRSGVVTELSFGFVVEQDRWEQRSGRRVRIVERAQLHELSLVTEAAYGKETNVSNRRRNTQLTRAIESAVERMRATPTPEPEPAYTPTGPHSYFRDLWVLAVDNAMVNRAVASGMRIERLGDPGLPHPVHGGVEEARERLGRLWREQRDLTTTATAGGGFVPTAPRYVAEAFSSSVRANAALPFVFPVLDLPEKGMTVGTPRLTTGMDTSPQSSENASNQETDMVEAAITTPVTTIAGQQDMSVQLLDRADPQFDGAVALELGRSLAADLDVALLTGSGTAPNLRGLDNVSGAVSVTYTDASPTQAELWPKVAEAASKLATALGRPPTHLLAHPRRLAWLAGWLDSAGAQVSPSFPFDLKLVPVSSITTLTGASTNEDKVYVVCAPELPILVAPPVFETRLMEPLSGTLTVRVLARQYASTLFARRPEAIAVISGTGLANPY